MELWIKFATTAIAQNDYELVIAKILYTCTIPPMIQVLFQILLCCKNVAKIHADTKPDCPTEEKLLLSMSNYFHGLGLSAVAAGNFAVLNKALDCLLTSARYQAPDMLMHVCIVLLPLFLLHCLCIDLDVAVVVTLW